MGVVEMITADIGDTSQWSTVVSAIASTDYARTGTKSFRIGASSYVNRAVAARADYYIRYCVYAASFSDANPFWLHIIEAANVHVGLKVLSDGSVCATRSTTTTLGTSAPGLVVPNAWNCIEVYATVHDSAGIVTVKVNGVTALSLTAQDTRNGLTGVISTIQFYDDPGGTTTYLDDVVIRDDAWPGQGGIYVLAPTGAGANAAWTASAGDPYACVNEQPPDFTDYIYTDGGTPGTKHDFAIADLGITPSSVAAVAVIALAKLAEAGSGSIRTFGLSTGDVGNGSALSLDVSATWAKLFMTVDPHTAAAWTLAGVNALTAGVETQ